MEIRVRFFSTAVSLSLHPLHCRRSWNEAASLETATLSDRVHSWLSHAATTFEAFHSENRKHSGGFPASRSDPRNQSKLLGVRSAAFQFANCPNCLDVYDRDISCFQRYVPEHRIQSQAQVLCALLTMSSTGSIGAFAIPWLFERFVFDALYLISESGIDGFPGTSSPAWLGKLPHRAACRLAQASIRRLFSR